jgi:acetyl esterase/lipase
MGYGPGRRFIEVVAAASVAPGGLKVQNGTVNGSSALRLQPEGIGDELPQVVWFHGGAFCFNSPRVYAAFAGALAKAIGTSVLLPSYRLAPEHPYPAALGDALAAYRAVAGHERRLIIGGDSAGANLAVSATIAMRDAGEALPAGMILMSPWVDLTMSGESVRKNDGKDAILRARYLPRHAGAYAGGLDLADPRISPLGADLAALPPALIQCGSEELFASESVAFSARLESAGVESELQIYPGMWHDFQTHAGMLDDATTAVERMAAWAKPLLA